nr:hypothetical protein GLYMA_17G188000 [Tanacetum cinerariifolium]
MRFLKHSASLPATAKATNSDSIVEPVMQVCFFEAQEIIRQPSKSTQPLVDELSSVFLIQLTLVDSPLLGVNTPRSDEDRLELMELMVFLLPKKVFTNMRRVGKGFFGVEIPLFEGMLVEQEIKEAGDGDEHVDEVTVVMMLMEMLVLLMEKLLLLLKNHPYHLLHHLLHHHNHLKIPLQHLRRVEHLEYDKVAQALKIKKLKRRVKKLEKMNKGRMIVEMDKDDVVVLMYDKEEDKKVQEAKVDKTAQDETEPAEVQKVVDVVTTAKLFTEVVTTASEIATAASAIISTVEPQVPTATLTATPTRVAAAPSRRRKGVVIRDPEEESTTSTIIRAETKSKDKGKGIW